MLNIALIAFTLVTAMMQTNEQAKSKDMGEYPGAVAALGKVTVPEVEAIPSFSVVFNDLPLAHLDGSNQGLKETEVKVGEYGVTEGYDATIAVVGSSHSEQWLGAVIKGAEDSNYRVLNITRSATRFSAGYKEGNNKKLWVDGTLEYIKNADIDLVVAHGTTADTSKLTIQSGLADQLQKVSDLGIEVLAIRDNPRYTFNIVESIEQSGEEETIKKMNDEKNQLDEEGWTILQTKYPSLNTIDLTKYFKVDGRFQPIIGNIVVYRDYDHITNTYAESFGPIFQKQFNEILKEK